jgi:hypothetical protein
MKLEVAGKIFEKLLNTKFNQNLFSESRVVLCGRKDGWTDMTKLIAAFRNFKNAQ